MSGQNNTERQSKSSFLSQEFTALFRLVCFRAWSDPLDSTPPLSSAGSASFEIWSEAHFYFLTAPTISSLIANTSTHSKPGSD